MTSATVHLGNFWASKSVFFFCATLAREHFVSWAAFAIFSGWSDFFDEFSGQSDWSFWALGLVVFDDSTLGGVTNVGDTGFVTVQSGFSKMSYLGYNEDI